MLSIAEEIQAVSENAVKSVDYPIGDKLSAFFKQQHETNFVLSGVLIFAASKIYGRKVDYLEQEIIGIAKNFEAVETSGENKPEKEIKKTRTKKFVIKDQVNLEKTTFEEKPINVLAKVDINKTLAIPSKINRLQKMKEFFAKNKSKTGKLVIPKNLLFNNDFVKSNFGATQIYDYDDNKDVVGSRRDFTSFSYFVNSFTGELQSDIPSHRNTLNEEDFSNVRSCLVYDDDRVTSPIDWTTRPDTPHTPPMTLLEQSQELPTLPTPPTLLRSETPPVNIDCNTTITEDTSKNPPNSIDEGINIDIEMDDLNRRDLLLDVVPTIKIQSPESNQSIDVADFDNSMLPVLDETQKEENLKLPFKSNEDIEAMKIKNIFLIPIKKLKHKCLFDLPNNEYGELKRRKKEQYKSVGMELTVRHLKAFNPFEMMRNVDDDDSSDDEMFLGFTKEQQMEPLSAFKMPKVSLNKSQTVDVARKNSNDSGLDCDSGEESGSKNDESSCRDRTISDNTDLDTTKLTDSINTSEGLSSEINNISGGDSCYQSLASGDSTKTELSSFFKDIESRNQTIDESEEQVDRRDFEEGEERVQQMKQSAINIAKWKEYLKPILADSEARSKIDMHQYGKELIGKIGNVSDTVTFDAITEEGKTPAYFLTMLQLINNRNVDIDFGERNMLEPVDTKNIKITLKSKVLHQDKFDEMGQQFTAEEINKVNKLKRKAVQTSTPAKRVSFNNIGESSISFINSSQSMIDDQDDDMNILSQPSSGYCSQSSVLSDF